MKLCEIKIKYCKCGCGQIVKLGNKYINGHNLKTKKYSEKTRKKISKALTGRKLTDEHKKNLRIATKKQWQNSEFREKARNILCKHHIYLKENNDEIILLSNSKHGLLHQRAYDYIYYKYGKQGIDDYLKWFDGKYGLKEK